MALSKLFSPTDFVEISELDLNWESNEVYLFTWNPKDRFVGDLVKPQFKWDSMITKVLQFFDRCMKYYCVIPEFSITGRLHCHGWFVIKDKVKWHKSVYPKMKANGFVKINKAKCEKSMHYYKKELDDTCKMLDHVPLCHYNCSTVQKEIDVKYILLQSARLNVKKKIKKVSIVSMFDALEG